MRRDPFSIKQEVTKLKLRTMTFVYFVCVCEALCLQVRIKTGRRPSFLPFKFELTFRSNSHSCMCLLPSPVQHTCSESLTQTDLQQRPPHPRRPASIWKLQVNFNPTKIIRFWLNTYIFITQAFNLICVTLFCIIHKHEFWPNSSIMNNTFNIICHRKLKDETLDVLLITLN